MTFTTRDAVPHDASALADLHVETWREAYAHLLPDGFFSAEYIAARHRTWHHVLTNPRPATTIRVAETEGAIIGFSWAGEPEPEPEPDAAAPRDRQLFAIYVLAAHYGTGAGQALLTEAIGDEPAFLWVAKENPRAVAFYERNGFRFDGAEQAGAHGSAMTAARMVR